MKKMKRIAILTTAMLCSIGISAQEDNSELKNFRFGLKLTPSINFYRPEGKILSGNGAVVKFGGGLITEFHLSKVISIVSGLQIDLDGGKIKYKNGGYTTPGANTISYYYKVIDDEIQPYGSRPNDPAAAANYDIENKHYQLNERKYNVTYLTIPVALKMKTKEIGLLTYYGVVGINNSFRWKARVTDEVSSLDAADFGTSDKKTKIDVTKDFNFYNGSVIIGGGAEMNLSGTTSLVFGLNYNLGFTNTAKAQSEYLERRANNSVNATSITSLTQKMKSNAIVITVGVLF